MNTKRFIWMIVSLFLLAGCLPQGRFGQSAGTIQATFTLMVPLPTHTPRPTLPPRPTATATADPAEVRIQQAVQAANAYFDNLAREDFASASRQLSTFSLAAAETTAGGAQMELEALAAQGITWSGFEVSSSQDIDSQTLLLQVRYTRTSTEGTSEVNELWSMRLEAGQWRYNWKNLIDTRSLNTPAQTVNGITIKPVLLRRFPDKVQLEMIMQNRTRETFVFGQPNEILGTFQFGDQMVEAVKTQIILLPLRTAPGILLDAPGFYDQFPESITIRKWQNLQVDPWYVFDLR